MTTKVFNLVSTLIGSVATASVAIVTYCVTDITIATAINSSITAASAAAIAICKNFVKDDAE